MSMRTITRSQWSWALYDWASSSFSTTVMAGFFPLFFRLELSRGNDPQMTTARLGVLLTLAGILVAFSAPFWGALSDHNRNHKSMLLGCLIIAVTALSFLATVPSGNWLMASLFFVLAVCAFEASQTFYDALLTGVCPSQERNFISALGYSLGYLGGGILFLLNVLMYLFPSFFYLSSGADAVRVSFISVAVWWVLFSLPLFFYVKPIKGPERKQFFSPWREVLGTGKKIWSQPALRYFLIGYWLYIDGVFTVMNMAVDFGMSIGLASQHLIGALLLVQFIGFPAALISGKMGDRWGESRTILLGLAVYLFVIVWGYFLTSAWQFYVMAGLIGLVQGGVQSISRALFSKHFPPEEAGEYFGFYNLLGRFAAILGPMIVAVSALVSSNSRTSLLGLSVLFFAGGFFLIIRPQESFHTSVSKS